MGARRAKVGGKNPPAKRTVRALNCGSRLRCVDNSGAKIAEIVAVIGYRGTRGRSPCATIGDMILVTVKSGTPDLRKKLSKAIIVSQKKEFSRLDGTMVKFEENTCILVDDSGNPRGSEIKAAVAKEVVERWPPVGKIASVVI